MPSQTTISLGSMAPGSRVRPDHLTPVPLPPLPVYCKQGEIGTLSSCTPPWMRLGVTYLRPRLAPPQPTFVGPAIPWLTIIAVASLSALVAIAAAHLLSIAATVHTVDSALVVHATELAQIETRAPAPPATPAPVPPAPEVGPAPSPFPLPTAKPGRARGDKDWILELPPSDVLSLPPAIEPYYEEVRRAGRTANP